MEDQNSYQEFHQFAKSWQEIHGKYGNFRGLKVNEIESSWKSKT